jgi:hypothetical protein
MQMAPCICTNKVLGALFLDKPKRAMLQVKVMLGLLKWADNDYLRYQFMVRTGFVAEAVV